MDRQETPSGNLSQAAIAASIRSWPASGPHAGVPRPELSGEVPIRVDNVEIATQIGFMAIELALALVGTRSLREALEDALAYGSDSPTEDGEEEDYGDDAF